MSLPPGDWLVAVDCNGFTFSLLQVVLCGAFYPNYFRWGVGDEEVNRKAFCGHNHCTTVMVYIISILFVNPSILQYIIHD